MRRPDVFCSERFQVFEKKKYIVDSPDVSVPFVHLSFFLIYSLYFFFSPSSSGFSRLRSTEWSLPTSGWPISSTPWCLSWWTWNISSVSTSLSCSGATAEACCPFLKVRVRFHTHSWNSVLAQHLIQPKVCRRLALACRCNFLGFLGNTTTTELSLSCQQMWCEHGFNVCPLSPPTLAAQPPLWQLTWS